MGLRLPDTVKLAADIRTGDRRALSAAVTLLESSRRDHQDAAAELCDELVRSGIREAVRVAISGAPGVGKSTMIDALGVGLAGKEHSIAVLAVDPSSVRSGGSILGDKTRMGRLASHPRCYVRPSPTSNTLGGVTAKTREVVFLFEQAGFDYVMIETTGVGQSETEVSEFSDVFILMVAPAGGDELQGVKRGIIEVADFLVVNKADGALLDTALATASEYGSAIRLYTHRESDPEGYPKVLSASAQDETGLDKICNCICHLVEWRKENGYWSVNRHSQNLRWLHAQLREVVVQSVGKSVRAQQVIRKMEQEIETGGSVFGSGVRQHLVAIELDVASGLESPPPEQG